MVRDWLVQYLHAFEGQAWAEQNMIKATLRTPTGEGGLHLRCQQPEVTQWRGVQQVVGVGVHVAHQHLMLIATNQLANIGQLPGTGFRPQRQMHDYHHQCVRAFAKTYQNRTATRRPGQGMILNHGRAQSAEQAIAVLGQTPEIAIELLIPVGEFALLGKILDLIDVAGTMTTTISFLQGNQVEVAEQVANALQVTGPAFVRQYMLPAAGQVMPVTLGAVTHLDIETEQS